MKISIIHPSFKRPQRAFDTIFDNINKKSINNELEYFLVLSKDDPYINQYQKRNSKNVNIVIDNGESNWRSAVNFGCLHTSGNSELIIVTADDFIFPQNWDTLLTEVIEKNPQYNNDFVIGVNDGNRTDNLLTILIFSKPYYLRIGYVIYREYDSVYGDNDFTEMAYYQNKVIEARHLLFKHNHYSFGGSFPIDETYKKINNANTRNKGKRVLEERRERHFDL